MLIWAVFTLGYFFGVFFSLTVLLKKDKIEEDLYQNNPINSENYLNTDSWEIFAQLTKINQPKNGSGYSTIRPSKTSVSAEALPDTISRLA